MMNNLNKALVSMGYRKLEPNKSLWMKPFGFSVIAIKIENNIVTMKILFNGKIKQKFGLDGNSTSK